MGNNDASTIKSIVDKYGGNKDRLLDIVRDTQRELGCVSDESVAGIARLLKLSGVDVEGVVTFYHFFSKTPVGKYGIYLNNSVTAVMNGRAAVAKAFSEAAGTEFGTVTADGLIGLFDTSCIGMNDQEPAAIINGTVFTSLTAEKAKSIVAGLKSGKSVESLVEGFGDGANQSELVRSMVKNNIVRKGPVLFGEFTPGAAIGKAVAMKPEEVIEQVKISNLRGAPARASPPAKWEFCRQAAVTATSSSATPDEGEPGTFKDRVILTELPRLLFEGMAVAGYAVGRRRVSCTARRVPVPQGAPENVLADLRKKNVLGKDAGGKSAFDFDIRITMGAGAYVCGEIPLIETAEASAVSRATARPSGRGRVYGKPTR